MSTRNARNHYSLHTTSRSLAHRSSVQAAPAARSISRRCCLAVDDALQTRFRDHKSCMFSSVDLCYNTAFIREDPAYRRVDWRSRLGFLSRLEDATR